MLTITTVLRRIMSNMETEMDVKQSTGQFDSRFQGERLY